MIQRLSQDRNKETSAMLLYRAGVIMLLAFYLTAFVLTPAGVPHVHDEDEFHHMDSCGKDACHITIYHPGSKEGCNHKFHFSKAYKECSFCNVALPRQIATSQPVCPELRPAFSFSYFDVQQDQPQISFIELTNRGPPCMV